MYVCIISTTQDDTALFLQRVMLHVVCVKKNDPNFGIPCISSTKVWSLIRLVRRIYQKWNPICPSMEMKMKNKKCNKHFIVAYIVFIMEVTLHHHFLITNVYSHL